MKKSIYIFALVSFIFAAFGVLAQALNPISQSDVWGIIENLPQGQPTAEKVSKISENFMGRPYQGGPAGEGQSGDFNQKPLATIEAFDCTTYVETVLALARTKNNDEKSSFEDFNRNMRKIKYTGDKEPKYENRNHFPELDWNPDLNRKGILKDITLDLLPNSPMREKTISKKAWYEGKTCDDLYLPGVDQTEVEHMLGNLKAVALKMNIEGEKVALPYVPLATCLTRDFQDSLPDISVFNLVKAEHTSIDIPVAISHQGFLIRKDDGRMYLRHANTKDKKVSEILFDDYIRERMLDSKWPTLGFNFQEIQD